MSSVADALLEALDQAGHSTGTLSDRALAYLTGLEAGIGSYADKAIALDLNPNLAMLVVGGGGPAGPFPDETNTGQDSAGLPVHGSSFINLAEGAVLEGWRVNGQVRVSTANVTIRNCYINSEDFWGIDADGSTNILVEDCTIVNIAGANASVLDGGNGIFRRLNCSGAQDGMKINNGSLVEDCYIHDLASLPESHNDGIQLGIANGVTLRHNTILSRDTSAILMGGGEARVRAINCLIEDNYLEGGGYPFYGPTGPGDGSNVTGGPSENVRVLNNTFGPLDGVGYVTQWEVGIGNQFSGNVNHLGAPVNPP